MVIMNRWLRNLRFRLQVMGPLGWAGGALWVAAVLLTLTMLLPGMLHLQQLEQDVAALHRDMPRHRGQWVDRSPQATLKAFYRFLPAESEASSQVTALFAAADAHGIDLAHAEYALVHDHDAALSRYQVVLPLHGTYAEIRHFVIALLNDMPALAVNELSFKREDAQSREVDASLRLTIFLGRLP